MPVETTTHLIDALRKCQLLTPAQLEEATRTLHARFPDPRALARELLQRNWLTPYQVNQLFQGRGAELVLGQYVILERLGEGGMGQVFKARQQRLNRLVALKVIRKDRLSNPDAVTRFHREVQAAAHLSHPNVVMAFDADQVGDVHFFAMEYVDGIDLARRVREQGPLPVAEACEYIRQAALGLQHAHEQGLVHRDIKPSNLLITRTKERKSQLPGAKQTPIPGPGMLKILDMGLARLQEGEDEATEQLTKEGSVMGTLDYLAPEQALNSRLADVRSDLYSLGCTFYFLLAGKVPFPGGTAAEKLLKHRLDESTPVEQLRPEVPPGVARVVRRLMAKQPADRYQTPAELAAVLSAPPHSIKTSIQPAGGVSPISPVPVRDGAGVAPVAILVPDHIAAAATPVRVTAVHDETVTSERGMGQALDEIRGRPRRLPLGWVVAGAGMGVCLLLLLVMLMWLRSRKVAVTPPPQPLPSAEATTEADLRRLKSRLAEHADDPQGLRHYLLEVRRAHPTEPQAIQAAELLAQLPGPLDHLDGRSVSDDDRTIAGAADGLVAVIGDQRMRHWGRATSALLSPDGQVVVSGGDDDTVRVWDPRSGRQLRIVSRLFVPSVVGFLGGGKKALIRDQVGTSKIFDPVNGQEFPAPPGRLIALAPDAETVAVLAAGTNNHIQLWTIGGSRERLSFTSHQRPVHTVAFTPDGRSAASAGGDPGILVWDTANGKVLHTLRGHSEPIVSLRFAAESRVLFSADGSGNLKIWDLSAPSKDPVSFNLGPWTWTVSPDGKSMVRRGADNAWHLYEGATDKVRAALPHHHPVHLAAFSPDGQVLATASVGGADSLKFWDTATGAPRPSPRPNCAGPVASVSFSRDGKTLVSAGNDGRIKVWDVASGEERQPPNTRPESYTACKFSHDGRTLALTCGATVQLWDTTTGRPRSKSLANGTAVGPVEFSDDDQIVATGGRDGSVKLWDLASGEAQVTLRGGQYPPSLVAFAPDGASVLVGEYTSVILFDAKSGAARATVQPTRKQVFSGFALSPDRKTLAAAHETGGVLQLVDVAAGKQRLPIRVSLERTFGIGYSPDGRLLLARGPQGSIKVWDMVANKQRNNLPAGQCLALSPDGQTAAIASNDTGDLRLFEAAGGQLKLPLEGHTGRVSVLVWTPDGQALVSAGNDGKLIVWDPAARKRRLQEWQLSGRVDGLVLSPDGRHMATINANGCVYVLRMPRKPPN